MSMLDKHSIHRSATVRRCFWSARSCVGLTSAGIRRVSRRSSYLENTIEKVEGMPPPTRRWN